MGCAGFKSDNCTAKQLGKSLRYTLRDPETKLKVKYNRDILLNYVIADKNIKFMQRNHENPSIIHMSFMILENYSTWVQSKFRHDIKIKDVERVAIEGIILGTPNKTVLSILIKNINEVDAFNKYVMLHIQVRALVGIVFDYLF